MEIVDRRVRRLTSLRDVPASEIFGRPYLVKKCDSLGCEAIATEHCSSHGAHFCRKHFESHRADWHCGAWATAVVARC